MTDNTYKPPYTYPNTMTTCSSTSRLKSLEAQIMKLEENINGLDDNWDKKLDEKLEKKLDGKIGNLEAILTTKLVPQNPNR
jgi:hypothetical protein